MSYTCKNYLFT